MAVFAWMMLVGQKSKKTKAGIQEYVYYRCSRYNSAHHPRTRLREEELDRQMLGIFDRMRVEDDEVRDWFVDALRSYTRGGAGSVEEARRRGEATALA